MESNSSETTSALSLLTPTESNALWSFLSQADSADVLAPEWGIFANRVELTPRNREVKEDLARATRSLTQLGEKSTSLSDSKISGYSSQQTRVSGQIYKAPNPLPRSSNIGENNTSQPPSHPRNSSSQRSEVRYDAQSAPSSSTQSIPVPIPNHIDNSFPEPVTNTQQSRKRLSQDQPQKSGSGNKRARKSSPSLSISINALPNSAQNRTAPVSPVSTGRRQHQAPQPLVIPPASEEPLITASPSPYSSISESQHNRKGSNDTPITPHQGRYSKIPLLSTSQKKANHIQSEQKRRANIRRGYEALCEIVPALREAIRAEEEAERLALQELEIDGTSGGGGSLEGNSAAAAAVARKKARGKAVAAAFGIEEGEKVDGRAGPRSEAVVLQKTIDHIGALEIQRTTLLDKIKSMRALLPPTHPALIPSPIPTQIFEARRRPFLPPPPNSTQEEKDNWNEGSAAPEFDERNYQCAPWERVWDGGTGLPIPGMGLPKPGMMGVGGGSGSGMRGSGRRGRANGNGDEMDEDDGDDNDESDDDM